MADARTVYLFDVDNTLLDHDLVTADLHAYMERELGETRSERYWKIFEDIRKRLGYADYLGALQQYRIGHPYDSHVLAISNYLINYPFADRVYEASFPLIDNCRNDGQVVILTDGDVVFQPRKIETSGLFEKVDGNILIYIHKEEELHDVERRYPAEHYVVIDDKLRILTEIKERWGQRVTTVFPRQGHYALDTEEVSKYPDADITVDSINELLEILPK